MRQVIRCVTLPQPFAITLSVLGNLAPTNLGHATSLFGADMHLLAETQRNMPRGLLVVAILLLERFRFSRLQVA
jgi:hypothetical protein